MKVRFDEHLACEIYIYVDDGRLTGYAKLICWKAARQFCAVLGYLGIQDAARKRTEPSREAGPWSGSVVHTADGVQATVTEVKWLKTRELVGEIATMMEGGAGIPHKRLEKIRGFLIYVSAPTTG